MCNTHLFFFTLLLNVIIHSNFAGTLEAQWTRPWNDKTFTVLNEYTTAEKNLLIQSDRRKDDMCATLLYCFEKKTTDCQSAVTKWWGGDASDTTEWEQLRTGYARICSATNYEYELNPTQNCQMTYQESSNSAWVTVEEQSQIPRSTRDSLISNCNDGTFCSIQSSTVAWVYGYQTSPRQMNLCPVMFWIQDDVQNPVNGGEYCVYIRKIAH